MCASQGPLQPDNLVQLVAEIGTYERHFNQIQSEYRKMASQWLLAAFGAIGLLLYSKDINTASALSPGLIASGVALAASIGILLLWHLDVHVYHRLLNACFKTGLNLESTHGYLPQIRTEMSRNRKLVSQGLDRFYLIGLAVMTMVGLGLVWGLVHRTGDELSCISSPILVSVGFGVVWAWAMWVMWKDRHDQDAGSTVGAPSLAAVDGVMAETTLNDLSDDLRRLVTAAQEATPQSYSPYSGLRVGAALLCRDGTVVTGTNMENTSYSLAICAERAALAAANSRGLRDFQAIAVTAHGPSLAEDDLLSPCGACRQTLMEFAQLAGQDIQVVLVSPNGKRVLLSTAQQLLPLSMGRNHVKADC